MSSGSWKNVFGLVGKPKVTVQVGQTAEEMTRTQAYRFKELTETGALKLNRAKDNPLSQLVQSLEDAAFRQMTDKEQLLQQAASGSIKLYIDARGLVGRWRRLGDNHEVMESAPQVLRSGYLELTKQTCTELTVSDSANVMVVEFPETVDPSDLNFETELLRELQAWGAGKKVFCLNDPRRLDQDDVVLLAAHDS